MEARLGVHINEDQASINSAIRDLIPSSQIEPVLCSLEWLFSPESLPPPPTKAATLIDHFSALLAHKLRYEPNERDMVILHHEIIARTISDHGYNYEEVHTSSLTAYGSPKTSAMSQCVGLPVAFSALQVLDGKVSLRGVTGPTHESIYDPVLAKLQEAGLGMKESVRRGVGIEDTLTAGLASRLSVSTR